MKVLCNQADCQHFKRTDDGVKVQRGRIRDEFGETYFGICEAEEIGISNKHIETHSVEYNIPSCRTCTQTYIVGHIDFSKYPGPSGSHI